MPLEPLSLEPLPLGWVLPAGVRAFMSTRVGGVSVAPYKSLNLGAHVGDEPAHVAENRRRFTAAIGARPCWLQQVHGSGVVDAALHLGYTPVEADASWTDQRGVACVVQVADCLPVLLAARNGRAVAAAHAGWRGLAAGVVEAALDAIARAAACEAAEIEAWIGPGIGPRAFEVGAEVPAAFDAVDAQHFVAQGLVDGIPRWRADLAGLARSRLRRAGLQQVSGGVWCSVEDASRFFSYRRDRVTGRLAAAIWLA
jgi:polyphenol oxidase